MTSPASRPPTPARTVFLLALVATMPALAPTGLHAQERTQAGPIIESAGAVFQVDPTLATPTDRDYRVAFEVAAPAASHDRLNVAFNTAARFLNMHGQAGVPVERLGAAIVVHGGASFELLDDNAYRERFGTANPNADLLRELIAKGHRVVLCGQSAASRGVPTDRLIEGVEVALSAMTAFLLLQDEGYRVNPW
ncbi:MAG: DsrE family protein [Gemmatimonadetes bacterium]|nr:DsrE family protein [Gemmatimonadota bacterium]